MKETPIETIDEQFIKKQVKTFGWITAIRGSSTYCFFDLYFNCKTLKCVASNSVVEKALSEYKSSEKYIHLKERLEKESKKTKESKEAGSTNFTITGNLTPHSSVYITAEIVENRGKTDLHLHKVEAQVTEIEVYALAPTFPLNAYSSSFTKLQYGHLHLRSPERILFLQCRSYILHLFREFYYTSGYFEVTPPTLVQTQVEGGSTLFGLKYYNEDAYLTQSSQLYLETVVPSVSKVFCCMPSYRAENSNTNRHLSEYTHLEGEIGHIDFNGLLKEIEAMLRYVVNKFYDKHHSIVIDDIKKKYKADAPQFDFSIFSKEVVAKPFARVKYAEAIEILIKNKVYHDKDQEKPYKYGDDISARDEVALVEIFGNRPVFLTNFPVEHKPFYCRKSDKGELSEEFEKLGSKGEDTESVDLLWPDIGEILGGSMRAEDYCDLLKGFEREGIDPEKYYWYNELRLFNANRHGGYGLGLERFIRALMGYENVNKTCLYPRFPGRCQP